MPLSPPVTIRTSFFAPSTMATALSTAECTRSNSPAASPSRCRVEFSVKESCRPTPRLAKMPFATPACRGSALAFGKLLTRTVAGSAAAVAASIARTRSHRWIICPPPLSPVDLSEYAGYSIVYCGAEVDPAGPIGGFLHACSRKGQSLLAARVHELLENQGVSHQERSGIRVDQRARQSGGDGGAAQARRAQRPSRRARRRHKFPRPESADAGTAEPGRAGEEARTRAARRVPVHPADPGGVARQALPQSQPADPGAVPSRVPDRRGISRIDAGRPRADLRADHEGSAGAALGRGHRALRRERPRAAASVVENLSGPQLLAHDGHLLRQAPPARGAGAHRLAPGAAHAPADADSRHIEYRAGSKAGGGGPRRAAASGQGLGRRKGGSMRRTMVALAAAALSFGAFAQQRNFDAVQIKTTKVAEGVYMLEGEGGNIGVSSGEDGVYLIDDQFAPLTPKIVAAVKAISDKPIRFLMNTHWHGDHVGGNENLGKAGVVIIAHDNVYKRMSVGGAITALKQNYAPAPRAALPVITFNQTATFRMNGDDVTSTHLPPAHTDGDSFVRFTKANVIHTGDVFAAYRYPFIDPESGGSVKGVLRAIDLMLPLMDDNTKVIPGHGGLSSKKDVLAYRKMVSTAISKIEPMVKLGRTLQQVVDAKPLREFDEEWGKFRKPEAFVEIVYNGLRKK